MRSSRRLKKHTQLQLLGCFLVRIWPSAYVEIVDQWKSWNVNLNFHAVSPSSGFFQQQSFGCSRGRIIRTYIVLLVYPGPQAPKVEDLGIHDWWNLSFRNKKRKFPRFLSWKKRTQFWNSLLQYVGTMARWIHHRKKDTTKTPAINSVASTDPRKKHLAFNYTGSLIGILIIWPNYYISPT